MLRLGRIPELNDEINENGFILTVREMSKHRVEKVQIQQPVDENSSNVQNTETHGPPESQLTSNTGGKSE